MPDKLEVIDMLIFKIVKGQNYIFIMQSKIIALDKTTALLQDVWSAYL